MCEELSISRAVMNGNLESLVEVRQDEQRMEFHKLENLGSKKDVRVVNSSSTLFT